MHLLLALPALAGPAAPKVYQGEPAEGFPTAVNVGVSDGGALVSVCTGVLVTEDAVVTAAHCLEELDVFSAAGLIPEVALEDGDTHRVAITEQVPHPEWDPEGEDRGFLRDVAVLHLAEAVATPPVVLAEAPGRTWLDQELTLVGYGATGNEGIGGGEKRKVVLPVVEEEGAILRLYEPGAGNLCTGDSGGPAYLGEQLVGFNVFTYQPEGGEGCEGGGTGTLLAEEVWDWVEAEAQGLEWTPRGCATAGGRPRALGLLLGLGIVLFRRRRPARSARGARRGDSKAV